MAIVIKQGVCSGEGGRRYALILKSDGIYERGFFCFQTTAPEKPTFALSRIKKVRLDLSTITVTGVTEDGFLVSRFYALSYIGTWGDAFRKVGIFSENEAVFARDSLAGFLCAYSFPVRMGPFFACFPLALIVNAARDASPERKWYIYGAVGFIVGGLSWLMGSLIAINMIFQTRSQNKQSSVQPKGR
jgi:hypothetical protein